MSILDKASLIQIPSGYKSTKLYSLRPSNGTGDFTFSRSSSGTRVNSEGLIETASVLGNELVVNGDFASDTDWTKGTGVTIANGVATSDGSGSNYGNIVTQDTNVSFANKKVKIKFDVLNYVSGKMRVSPGNSSATSHVQANGSYEFIVDVGVGNDIIYFINYQTPFVGSIDNVSVKEVIENDVPRLDYSDASCASLLLEGQSTNLVTYSESFDNSYWTKSGASVTSGFTSPDGTNNAYKLVEGTNNGTHYLEKLLGSADGNTNTVSLFAKKSERNHITIYCGGNSADSSTFNLNNGTSVDNGTSTSKIELISNGWYRCSVTSINKNKYIYIMPNNGESDVYTGDGTSGVYIYGAQLEQGSYPTSYIPSNSGSQTTRSADSATGAGTSDTFNDSEGVLFAEISRQKGSVLTTALSINNGSLANSVNFYYYSTNVLYFDIFSGVTTVSGNVNIDTSILNKIALKYKSGDISLYANGLKLITNTNAISLSGLNELDFNFGAGNQPFYGKCKQLMTFNEALSDEELSDLTGQANLSFNNLATFYNYTIL